MSKSNEKKSNSFYELIKTLFYAGTIAVLFRSILFEPFNIPSGSMIPSLLVGDYLFVSKYSYGYSRYSFPFGILPINDRLIYDVPQRGDIIVFRKPGDEQVDYIKRLIGLISTKGLTLIATKVFEQNGFIKVEIALSKGKKNFDKRSKMTEKRVKKEIRNYK